MNNYFAAIKRMFSQYSLDDGKSLLAVKIATKRLTNAKVLKLRAKPQVLVKQVANKIHVPLWAMLHLKKTGAYTESSDNIKLEWNNGSSEIDILVFELTGRVAIGDATLVNPMPLSAFNTWPTNRLSNASIDISISGNAELGGGNVNNYVDITLAYITLSKEDYSPGL